jgi:hypothetical protein
MKEEKIEKKKRKRTKVERRARFFPISLVKNKQGRFQH